MWNFLSCNYEAINIVFYLSESIFNIFLTGNEFTDDDAKYFADALSVSLSFCLTQISFKVGGGGIFIC